MAVATQDKPACMTDEEHEAWLEAAVYYSESINRSKGYQLGIRPCADCPRWFAAEMQRQDRCDGVPGRYSDHTPEERARYNMFAEQRRRERRKAAA